MAGISEVETFDFPKVSVGFFLQRVKDEMMTDMKKNRIPSPILGIGLAGIGKTEGIEGVCKELGIGFQQMRLVNYTETDLIGIPHIANGRTEHATNVLFPSEERDGKYGILLVDEFTSAPSNIQVPILQLTDKSRSVGQYKLPDGWKIVITGNGPNDGGTFTNLPGTVISRASCYRVEPTVESWLDWASKNNVHPAIRAFVKYSPDNLHGYTEDEASGYDRAFPCPRSWTKLSVILTDYDERFPNWAKTPATFDEHSDLVEILVAANIGETTARTFMAFLKFEKDLIDPIAICKAGTPEARKALAPAKDAAGRVNREAFYLSITHLADTLGLASQQSKWVDVMRKFVAPEMYAFVANSINWVLEVSDSADITTFAIAEINSSLGGIAAYLVSQPTFTKMCPRFSEFAKTLNGVFRV